MMQIAELFFISLHTTTSMKLSDTLSGFWLDKRKGFSKRTMENYTRIFRYLGDFLGDVEFTQISSDDIRRFLDHLADTRSLSRRSVHDAWVPLSSLWTWAEKELGTTHIIRGKVEAPRFAKTPIEPFTQNEIRLLAEAAEYSNEWETRRGRRARSRRATALRDKAIILTLLDSGLRVSELCDLTIKDYDLQRGRLHILHGKGDKSRYVFLGDRSRKALWRYLATRENAHPTDPLFATKTNNHINRHNLHHMLKVIGEQAGVTGVHPHRFRHTFAITFLRNGGNVFELQKILGHESLATVLNYSKLAEMDIENAGKSRSPADKWKI
jgi:integrase/recombinase XerD